MKLLFSLLLIFIGLNCFASGETLYEAEYSTTSGSYWVSLQPSTELNTPCTSITFKVDNYTAPSDYQQIVKYQWYINSILVKTVPYSTNSNTADLIMLTTVNLVTCIITYSNGTQTTTGNSNAFRIACQELAVSLSEANEAISGCSNSVAFSSSTYSGGYAFTPGAYTVQWTPPSNWVQNTISSDGHNVSYFPNATTGGNIVANVHLNACNFTQAFSLFITRTTPAPLFISPNKIMCQTITSGNYAINGGCGATSYTYKILGNSGCVFANNNLQSLTTTATNVNLTFSQTDFIVTLSVVANYPVNGSSLASVISIYHGNPSPTNLRLSSITCPEYTYNCDYVSPYSYNWSYYNPTTHVQTNLVFTSGMAKIVFPTNGTYNIGVSRTNSCGTSPVSFISTNVTCSSGGGGYRTANGVYKEEVKVVKENSIKNLTIFPNPANDNFTIDMGANLSNVQKNNLLGIKSIVIYNQLGKLIISHKYSGSQKSISVSTKNLISGIYTVKTVIGEIEKTTQLVISKK